MGDLSNKIDAWITAFFEMLASSVGAVVKVLEVPAQAVGVPAGVMAALLLLAFLVVLWRAMAKRIM